MIDALTITNVWTGVPLTLNDLNYPIENYATEVVAGSTDRPKGSRHGSFSMPTYLGQRNFHFEGQILGSGASDALAYTDYVTKRRNLIRSVMPHNERFTDESCTVDFLFTGMAEHCFSLCTIDGYPEVPMSWDTGSRSPFQLNLKSFDPRIYGTTLQSATLTHNVAATPNNAGEIEVYPIITITGGASGVTSYQFRWGTGAGALAFRSVTYNAAVTAGNVVTIDFDKVSAVDQTGANKSGNLSVRDWWALEPGNNTVIYIGSGGTPAGTTVALNWRHAYML